MGCAGWEVLCGHCMMRMWTGTRVCTPLPLPDAQNAMGFGGYVRRGIFVPCDSKMKGGWYREITSRCLFMFNMF